MSDAVMLVAGKAHGGGRGTNKGSRSSLSAGSNCKTVSIQLVVQNDRCGLLPDAILDITRSPRPGPDLPYLYL